MEQDKRLLIAGKTFNREQLDELLLSNSKCDFVSCKFNNVRFNAESDLRVAPDCEFKYCEFDFFNGKGFEANNSKFYDCTFHHCDLSEGHFISAEIYNCNFYKTNLSDGNFTLATFRHSSFNRETDLSAAQFYGAKMDNVSINDCVINQPVEGLYRDYITMSGGTPQETEVKRSIIFDKLKIEPLKELNPTQQEIDVVANYELIYEIPESEKTTQWFVDHKNINNNRFVVKGNITEPVFSKQLDEVLQQIGITKQQLNSSLFETQRDMIAFVQKQKQFEIIQNTNPAPNEYTTWIRNSNDIKTFKEAFQDPEYIEYDSFTPDYSKTMAENALKTGNITVYSSYPIEQGVFVTPSRMEAESYSGNQTIYKKSVNINDIAWIDITQGQYADVTKEFKDILPNRPLRLENDFWAENNSLDIGKIEAAFEEFSPQQVFSVMTQEQLDLFASYYEDSIDFAGALKPNLSAADKQLYEAIVNARKNADYSIHQQDEILESKIEPQDESISNKQAPDKTIVAQYREQNKLNVIMQYQNGQYYNHYGYDMAKDISDSIAGSFDSLEEAKEIMLKHRSNAVEINEQAKSIEKMNIDISRRSLTKDEFNQLTSEIKDIAKTYQSDPDLLTDYLAFKAQFYQYSPTNTMLIYQQNPNATFVASFTKWKQLGYNIKRGQHHIKISRPIEISKFPREVNGKTVWTDIKYASPEEKAKIADGLLEVQKTTKFIPHQVFDISQTDCPVEDYPKFYNMGHPDMEQQQLYECVKQYAKESGFTVTEEDLSSISLHGYYNPQDDSIHINSLLEDSGRLETMCHELAHGVLHKTSTQPTEIKELEAESFSAMLKRKMGFPVSEESKRYIKQYATKCNSLANAKFDMSKTLDRLSKTFNHVTKGIEETISNMGFKPEREIAQNLSQAKNNAVNVSKISENFIQALS